MRHMIRSGDRVQRSVGDLSGLLSGVQEVVVPHEDWLARIVSSAGRGAPLGSEGPVSRAQAKSAPLLLAAHLPSADHMSPH
jgi:hypothetical protein